MSQADWSVVPVLLGEHALLEPLQHAHAAGLTAAVRDGELWKTWYSNTPSPNEIEHYISTALYMQRSGMAQVFVVRAPNGTVLGSTRFYDIARSVPRLEIGYTWYARSVQRTGVNTEVKLMLLRHAFETLGCICVGFKTSWFNHVSRAAIARLGAKQDGVLRNHMRHRDGSVRDSVAFSIIDGEWPAVKRHLQSRLEQYK